LLDEALKFKVKEKDIYKDGLDKILFGDYFNGIDGENRPYV
jgi:hypothetical protein